MIKTVYLSVAVLCVLLSVIIFAPYVKSAFPKKTGRSLRMKMTLSTLFVIAAAASAAAKGNASPFALLMLAGFAFAWAGDFILGRGDGSKLFLSGLASFFFTHVFYIAATFFAAKHFFPSGPVITLSGIAAGFIAAALVVLLSVKRKARFHGLLVPAASYTAVLITMFAQACSFGIRLFAQNKAAIIFPLGAFFFVFSDVTLGMTRFRMHKKVFPFCAVCSVSYFVGQLLLALSLGVIVY